MTNRNIHPLPGPGDMVLDPGPRGIDTSAGNIGRAVAVTPTLRIEGVLDEARGRAALGKGIGDVGNAMGELALKQLEAIGIRQEADAQDMLIEAEGEIKAKLATEPDEMKWEGLASEHMEKVRSKLNEQKLSPHARAAVDMNFRRWQAHRVSGVKVASMEQSISRAKGKMFDVLKKAELTGDIPLGEGTIKGMEALGYISTERGDVHRVELHQAVERVEKRAKGEASEAANNSVKEAAYANPESTARDLMMQDENGNYLFHPDADFEQRKSLVDFATHRAAELHREEYNRLVDQIVSGDIQTPQMLDSVVSDRMDPSNVNDLKTMMLKKQDIKYQQELEAAIPENSMNLWREARDYKPSGDEMKDEWDAVQFRRKVKTLLPEGEQKDALDRFNRSWKPHEIPVDEDLNSQIKGFSKDVMDAGVWGVWESKVRDEKGMLKLDKDGKEQNVVDHTALRKADAARVGLVQQLQGFVKAHPNASSDEVLEKGNELLGKDGKMLLQRMFPDADPNAASAALLPPVTDWNEVYKKMKERP